MFALKKYLLLILCFSFCHLTCLNQTYDDNKVKVKNELSETLTVVKIGDVEYQNISAGSTSEEKSLNGGSYKLTATTERGMQYNQQVNFLGRFLKFLVIFKVDGSIEIRRGCCL